jgi:hypothetical protein
MKKLFFISSLLLVFGLTTLSFAQVQVESGTWGASSSTTGYTLNKNEGDRSVLIEVAFDTPFEKKPKVVLGITMLDASSETNVRYSVSTMSVSRDGFTIKIATWSVTKIYGISGSWVAQAKKDMTEDMN